MISQIKRWQVLDSNMKMWKHTWFELTLQGLLSDSSQNEDERQSFKTNSLVNVNDQVLTKFLNQNLMRTILLIAECSILKAKQSERRKKFAKRKNATSLLQSVLTARERQSWTLLSLDRQSSSPSKTRKSSIWTKSNEPRWFTWTRLQAATCYSEQSRSIPPLVTNQPLLSEFSTLEAASLKTRKLRSTETWWAWSPRTNKLLSLSTKETACSC